MAPSPSCHIHPPISQELPAHGLGSLEPAWPIGEFLIPLDSVVDPPEQLHLHRARDDDRIGEEIVALKAPDDGRSVIGGAFHEMWLKKKPLTSCAATKARDGWPRDRFPARARTPSRSSWRWRDCRAGWHRARQNSRSCLARSSPGR